MQIKLGRRGGGREKEKEKDREIDVIPTQINGVDEMKLHTYSYG